MDIWRYCFYCYFFVNTTEAKSLKKGEVYSLLNGRETIEVISSSELEMTVEGQTILAEYNFKEDKLRVVANVMGTKTVQYYLLTNEGLKEEKTGQVYYSKTALVMALERQRAEEEKRRAEQAKREAVERTEWEKWVKERFTFSDLTVLHKKTKLMWIRDGNIAGEVMNWDDAFKFIESLNKQKYAGYNDWRLPSKEDLETLVNFAKGEGYTENINEYFNKIGFKNVQASYYWSSTTYAYYTGDAWLVYMYYGYVGYYFKAYGSYVLPVRAGQ